jgi:hypothetical protein
VVTKLNHSKTESARINLICEGCGKIIDYKTLLFIAAPFNNSHNEGRKYYE